MQDQDEEGQALRFKIQLATWQALDRGVENDPDIALAAPDLVAIDVSQYDCEVEKLMRDEDRWLKVVEGTVAEWQRARASGI